MSFFVDPQIVGAADEAALDDELASRAQALLQHDAVRYRRLWGYYRNTLIPCAVDVEDHGSSRPYRQAQEWGLPSRITGRCAGAELFSGQILPEVARKEVVIENDIGWRIDTLVDYLFGRPIVINSSAPDPARRPIIEELLRLIIAQAGGITFLQQLALLGSVYGFVDVLVKLEPESARALAASGSLDATTGGNLSGSCGTQDLGTPPAMSGRQDRSANRPDSSHQPLPDGAGTSDGNRSGASRASDRSLPPSAGSAHEPATPQSIPGASNSSPQALWRLARRVRLEIVEPARALPVLSAHDSRCVDAYAQVYHIRRDDSRSSAARRRAARAGATRYPRQRFVDRLANGRSLTGLLRRITGAASVAKASDEKILVVDLITAGEWKKYEDGRLVARGKNSLGQVPLVHVQNLSVPFEYGGAGDVEPLIPMQDELNTRLSDRSYRITMQSFKMYLGKGIEHFNDMPVSPGRMWMTDNENADVIEFGGDGKTFSEDNHIIGIRDAMDKISGVTPIAAGAIKGRIGRLTSAAALRVTMLALLAKTERKRTTYGNGISRLCELALAWLDRAGLFATSPQERRVELHWPSPIPVNELERLQEAQAKLSVGVPGEVVLRELGY
jgi:hypothetical protein